MKRIIYILFALALFYACEDEQVEPNNNVVSGSITQPTKWTADRVWVVDGGINVESDLVIEAGTTIKFNEDAYITIGMGTYGSLIALGTPDKPIKFTSNANIPSPGDWRGLEFWDYNANLSSMAYCTVEYAGGNDGYSAAVYVYDTELSMVSCEIKKSESYGVYCDYGSFKLFSLNTIADCGDFPLSAPASAIHNISSNNLISGKGVYVNSSELADRDETWHLLTVPYVLDILYITNDAVLTIEPGCVLKFNADGGVVVGSTSYGKLIADGSIILPIVFTSSASFPSKGDWRGIEFWDNTSNGTVLNNCTISFAGSNEGYGANIYIYDNGSNVEVTNCEIGHSENCGIYNSYATPTITNILYIDNENNLCAD